MGFGHKETGKSYTVQGESSLVDLGKLSTTENDARGCALRALCQIKNLFDGNLEKSNLTLSICDITMDNIRDLLKYVQKLKRHQTSADLGLLLQKHTGI